MRALLLFALLACGKQPRIEISAVDPDLQTAFETVRDSAASIGYPDLFEFTDDGAVVAASTAAIESLMLSVPPYADDAHTYCAVSDGLVILPSPFESVRTRAGSYVLDEEGTAVALAHALGHAGGLGHAPKGLMTASLQLACSGWMSGKCLVWALGLKGKKK